jgi:hypothetical protein
MKFFHACTSQKRRRNAVEQIRDEEGHLYTEPVDIEATFVRYYTRLFMSARPHNIEMCISAIGRRVTDGMNEKLNAIFTSEEVKQALDQMGPLKAPGPNRFTTSFYQHNWETIGPEVCEAALYFLNSSYLDVLINATNIALIPKGRNLSCVTEFRPISLCNVLYKIFLNY